MSTVNRQVTAVKGIKSLHYSKRIAENLPVGAKAWVSFDGRKALPVTVTAIDDRRYDVRMERASHSLGIRPGNIHALFRDEVHSTPEAACMSCVTC